MMAVADLAFAAKAAPINQNPSCWYYRIDEAWEIATNPHKVTDRWRDIDIEPFTTYVQFNGWPAGIIGADGSGCIAAGEAANIETFVAAIEKRIEELKNEKENEKEKE